MFASESCGPCKALKPALIDVCTSYAIPVHIHMVSGRDDPEILKHGVRAVPTVILFYGDIEVDRFTGTMSKVDLFEWIVVRD
jgi:thioredoxin-like negative regulator of GroEL